MDFYYILWCFRGLLKRSRPTGNHPHSAWNVSLVFHWIKYYVWLEMTWNTGQEYIFKFWPECQYTEAFDLTGNDSVSLASPVLQQCSSELQKCVSIHIDWLFVRRKYHFANISVHTQLLFCRYPLPEPTAGFTPTPRALGWNGRSRTDKVAGTH